MRMRRGSYGGRGTIPFPRSHSRVTFRMALMYGAPPSWYPQRPSSERLKIQQKRRLLNPKVVRVQRGGVG